MTQRIYYCWCRKHSITAPKQYCSGGTFGFSSTVPFIIYEHIIMRALTNYTSVLLRFVLRVNWCRTNESFANSVVNLSHSIQIENSSLWFVQFLQKEYTIWTPNFCYKQLNLWRSHSHSRTLLISHEELFPVSYSLCESSLICTYNFPLHTPFEFKFLMLSFSYNKLKKWLTVRWTNIWIY